MPQLQLGNINIAPMLQAQPVAAEEEEKVENEEEDEVNLSQGSSDEEISSGDEAEEDTV